MYKFNFPAVFALCFGFSLLLTACGGGGGDDDLTPGPVGPPTDSTTIILRPAGTSAIDLSWTAVPGATFYRISRRSPAGSGDFTLLPVGDVRFTSHRDTGLTPATEYEYVLRACNTSGCSEDGPSATATTFMVRAGVPSIPDAPRVTVTGTTSIELSWTAVQAASFYRISRRSPAGGGAYIPLGVGDVAGTTHSDTGLMPGTEYEYVLRACNSVGCSDDGSARSATTTSQPPGVVPAVPGMPMLRVAGTTAIDLSWAPVQDATFYRIFRRSPAGNGAYGPVPGDIAQASQRDTGLMPATEYEYVLRACNTSGCSANGPSSMATTEAVNSGVPPSPNFQSARAIGPDSIELMWNARSANTTGFRIFRRSPAGSGAYSLLPGSQADGTTIGSRLLDENLNPATEYEYVMRACNEFGCSDDSAPRSATTQPAAVGAPDVPEAPMLAAAGATSINLSWTQVDRATSYQISRRSPAGSGDYAPLPVGNVSGTSHTDTGLTAETEYEYVIQACVNTDCSENSPSASTITANAQAGTLSAPILRAISNAIIEVSWSAVTGADSYRLFRSEQDDSATAFQLGDSLSSTIIGTNYSDFTLIARTRYYYWLQSCTNGSCSDFSGASSTMTLASPSQDPSGSPIARAETIDHQSIRVTWAAATRADSYQIWRGGTAGRRPVLAANVSGTSYIDTGLMPNTQYSYRTRACSTRSCASIGRFTSSFSGLTSFARTDDAPSTPPSVPGAPSLTGVDSGTILLEWEAVESADSYQIYRRSPAGAGAFTMLATVRMSTAYQDAGLMPETQYEYRLRACAFNACSADGSAASVRTPVRTGPPPPGKAPYTAVLGDSMIELIWQPVASATSYQVFRSEQSDAATAFRLAPDKSIRFSSFLDTGLAPETTYYYWIRACDASECSVFSSSGTAKTVVAGGRTPPFRLLPGPVGVTRKVSSIGLSNLGIRGLGRQTFYRRSPPGSGAFFQADRLDELSNVFEYFGLMPDTRYELAFRDCEANNICSPLTIPVITSTVGLKPATPNPPMLEAVGTTAIELRWPAVLRAFRYRISRRSPADIGTYEDVSSDAIVNTSYRDTGLMAGTEYQYVFRACNSNGCSDNSPAASVSTLTAQAGAPGTPAAPVLSVSDSASIGLSWSAVTDATFYRILRRSPAGSGAYDVLMVSGSEEITGTMHSDTGLKAATEYEYALRACNDNGCSDDGSVATATTSQVEDGTLSAPVLTAISNSVIEVSWPAVTDTDGYRLFRNLQNDSSTAAQIGDDISGTSYSDTTLTGRTRFYYWLQSCSNGSCSGFSDVSSVVTLRNPTSGPDRTQEVRATVIDHRSIRVNWDPVERADRYLIARIPRSFSTSPVPLATVTSTSYLDTGLVPDTFYWYRVYACNTLGCGANRVTSLAGRTSTAPPPTPPDTPGMPSLAVVGSGTILLEWTAVEAADSYQIDRRSPAGTGTFEMLVTLRAVTSYQDTGLMPETQYEYRLRACTLGACSADGSAASETTPVRVGPPSLSMPPILAVLSESSIELIWRPVAQATSYQIFRSEQANSATAFQIASDTTFTGFNFIDVGLEPETRYYYWVRACDDSACSALSSAIDATTLEALDTLLNPPTPFNLQAVGRESIGVQTENISRDHWRIYQRSPAGSGDYFEIARVSGIDSTTIRGLTPDTTYDFVYRNCDLNRGCSARSRPLAIRTRAQ